MARPSTHLFLAFLMANSLAAQPLHNYSLSPGATRKFLPMDQGSGASVYVCDRAFGYDSSRVELLWTDAEQTTLLSVSHRLVYPLTFLNDAVKLDDGFLVAGGNVSSSTLPFLLKFDQTGSVAWYEYFDNFGTFDQDQIVQVLSRGDAFTAYSYKGGTYDDHIYRVEGVPDGSVFTGERIGAPAQFRMYTALATADPLRQLVGGTGTPTSTPGNIHAMLMLHGGNGATWMKYYDLGGDYIEDIYGLTATSDGNYVACGSATLNSSFFGVVLKVDPQGDVIWCRKLYDQSGGLQLSAVHELASGELLVCGSNGNYIGALAKLDANGFPVSARWFADDRLQRFAMSGSTLLVCGAYSRVELDAGGEGCGFTDVNNLTDTTFTPPVISLTPTVTATTPTTTSLTAHPRTPELSMAAGCVWSGANEILAEEPLSAYPVPTDRFVRLGGFSGLNARERIVLRDALGAVRYDGPYGEGVDLQALPPGAYTCSMPRLGRTARVMKE